MYLACILNEKYRTEATNCLNTIITLQHICEIISEVFYPVCSVSYPIEEVMPWI